MFGRSKALHDPLWELRTSLLNDPLPEAVSLIAPGTSVWGVLMETGDPQGPVTLLTIGDGTASLYFPTGSDVLGAVAHAAVRAATTALLVTASAMRSVLSSTQSTDFPGRDQVRFFVLTVNGVPTAEGNEQSLGRGAGPLSAIFRAGQAVISQTGMASQESSEAA